MANHLSSLVLWWFAADSREADVRGYRASLVMQSKYYSNFFLSNDFEEKREEKRTDGNLSSERGEEAREIKTSTGVLS